MLQSLNPLQDENSQPYTVKGRQGNVARLGGGLGKTPVGKTPFETKTGLGSTRKALGNITNRPSNLHEAAIPRSGTKAPLTQRKTLGDITNTPAKAAANLKAAPQKPAQQKQAASKPQTLAELYAQDGIEQLAGKSGQQLDLEREARDLAETQSKAAYIASLPALRLPRRQRFQALQDFANLEVEEVEAPASPQHITPCLDDLLTGDSPSSLLPEISVGDLAVLSDLESDDDDVEEES